MAKGVANHRNGGRDPTELELAVQPANTARPVETTPVESIPPSRLWVGAAPALHGFLVVGER